MAGETRVIWEKLGYSRVQSQTSHRQPWDGTWGLHGENPATACL